MPNKEKMTPNERRKYLRLIKKRYLKASNFERGRLLDEMEAITGLHRKSLIRLMSGSLGIYDLYGHIGRSFLGRQCASDSPAQQIPKMDGDDPFHLLAQAPVDLCEVSR